MRKRLDLKFRRSRRRRYSAWTGRGLASRVTSGSVRSAASLVIGDRLLPGERNGMKIRHPLLVVLVVAVAVALASVAVAVAAESPFKGTVNAVETSQVVFPIASIDRVGTGTATHLGKFTEHVTEQVNLLTLSATGAATFTAANGDTLTASVTGQATETSPGVASIVEVYTITGGTGRFAGATGTFTLESTLNLATGVSSGTFSGVIDY